MDMVQRLIVTVHTVTQGGSQYIRKLLQFAKSFFSEPCRSVNQSVHSGDIMEGSQFTRALADAIWQQKLRLTKVLCC